MKTVRYTSFTVTLTPTLTLPFPQCYTNHDGLSLRTGVFAGVGLGETHASLKRACQIPNVRFKYGGHSIYLPSTLTRNATPEDALAMFEAEIELVEAHDNGAAESNPCCLKVLRPSYNKQSNQTAARVELRLVQNAMDT